MQKSKIEQKTLKDFFNIFVLLISFYVQKLKQSDVDYHK